MGQMETLLFTLKVVRNLVLYRQADIKNHNFWSYMWMKVVVQVGLSEIILSSPRQLLYVLSSNISVLF
jgi:hypothetical protein